MWVPFVKATQLVISAESFFNWALSLVPILLQYWKYPDQISTFFVFLSYHVLILLPNNLWLDQSYMQSQWMGNIIGWHPPYVFHPVGFTIAVGWPTHFSRGKYYWYIHRVTGCSYPGLRSGTVFWGLISFSNAALVYTSSMLCTKTPTYFSGCSYLVLQPV